MKFKTLKEFSINESIDDFNMTIKEVKSGFLIDVEMIYDAFYDNFDRVFKLNNEKIFTILSKDWNNLIRGDEFIDPDTRTMYYSYIPKNEKDIIYIIEEDDVNEYKFYLSEFLELIA